MSKRPVKKPVAKSPAPQGDTRLSQLQNLIDLMVEKDIVEVEVEEQGTRWKVRRREPQQQMMFAAPSMAMPSLAAPGVGNPYAASAPVAAVAAEAKGEVFKSPMLGTFYRGTSPEAEAFAKPGDRVTVETTLCIIEAMKVMNEIKAEREFEILEVLVKNGDPIEYGQPLFVIR